MKSIASLSNCLIVVIAMMFCPCHLQAQTDPPAGRRLAFLSADDRAHLLKVRHQVLESNPALKTEQESLEKERQYVKNKGTGATDEDRQTLRQNFLAHSEKMEAAMIQADPTVSPIIDQIKAKMQERMDKKGAAGDDSSP